jgi:hypothetical protein
VRRTQNSVGNRRVEIVEIACALIEIVAVGDPGVADEIAEAGVDSGAQNDAICGSQRSLGANGSQIGISRAESGNDDS